MNENWTDADMTAKEFVDSIWTDPDHVYVVPDDEVRILTIHRAEVRLGRRLHPIEQTRIITKEQDENE